MEVDNSAKPAAASSTSSPLSSTSSKPSSSPPPARAIAPPVFKSGNSYWWREEEIQLFYELVEGCEETSIVWEEIARELARQCPMAPAPARTAQQCLTRWTNLKRRSSRQTAGVWNFASWGQLEKAVVAASKGRGGEGLSTEQWGRIGDTLVPKRSAAACASRWKNGAPKAVRETAQQDEQYTPNSREAPVDTSTSSSFYPRPSSFSSAPRTTASQTSLQTTKLDSASDRPFSPEDDGQFLELYRLKGPAYKTISRAMEPQRHKKEVRERLDYLLQPYDFSVFFPSAQTLG